MQSIKEKMPRKKREKRPPKKDVKLSYETVMVKKGKQIVYQCVEKPTGSILCENFFKEESVDGALIGGASLDGRQFANIINIFNGINLK